MRKNDSDERLQHFIWKYPELRALLEAYQIPYVPEMTMTEMLTAVPDKWLRDKGLDRRTLVKLIKEAAWEDGLPGEPGFCPAEETGGTRQTGPAGLLHSGKGNDQDGEAAPDLKELAVREGTDKSGNPEGAELILKKGDVICVTGTTGSGKTRLLEDIEYLASGDTPSKRKIYINGKLPDQNMRDKLENRMCAYLAQSMNFVMELSCEAFIRMHAACRGIQCSGALTEQVIDCANQLAGEAFTGETMITQLSGGQSRALMIADLVYISAAPVVLIDEPENAGIDKHAVIDLLSGSGRIVLISTHDPVLALSCPRRIVLKNGGISGILDRTEEEIELLARLRKYDDEVNDVRVMLRSGGRIGKP